MKNEELPRATLLGAIIGILARTGFIIAFILYLTGYIIWADIFFVIWIITGILAWIYKL